MQLAWLDAAEWRALLAERGVRVDGLLRLVRPPSLRAAARTRSGSRARLVVAALLVVLAPSTAAADIVRTPAAHSVFTLQPNGVLGVLERLDASADAPTLATWQVTMQRGELFAEPSLVVGGRRLPAGRRQAARHVSDLARSGGVRFDWLQPPGTRPVRLGYRLALFGTAYTDVVDLHVPVWESWPTPVGQLTAALKLPRVPRGRGDRLGRASLAGGSRRDRGPGDPPERANIAADSR